MEVAKAEVSLEDLFSGSNAYAKQMKEEYENWKLQNPGQELTEKDYEQVVLHSRAFQYDSIRDGQEKKEFWGQIASLAVIAGASIICPPAGMALGIAYGTLELESAVSGKDWISGRELGTGERVFRGVLAPLNIVPGVSGLSKFSSTVRLAHMGDMAELGLKTGLKAGIQRESRHVANMVIDAGKDSATRIRSAKAWAKEVPGKVKQKVADDIIDTARLMDSTCTFAKNILPSRQMGLLAEGVGSIRAPAENTRTVEDGVRALFSKTDEVNIGSGPGNKGAGEVNRLIPGTPGKVTGGSSTKLGKNMFEEMGLPKTTKRTPYQAQHIIPKEFRSHPVLQKIGMDMDDASNGFFLRAPDANVSVTSRHKGYHAVYSNFVRGKLDEIDIRQDISIIEKQVFELQQRLRLLQEKGLPLYMQDNYLENELKRIKEIGMEQYKKERMDKEVTTPVWKRGEGATVNLWERWYNK
ncbi:AHH domain-containing protein [Heyndrickxia coagulans]|uniref:AHH domain-containing protein n=1 Tax=Heyndrickxia coagulans TaxID=1398 RepID=UPI001F1C3247|nr:AHH domain-containing protein [Heyndrickxia coagulans]